MVLQIDRPAFCAFLDRCSGGCTRQFHVAMHNDSVELHSNLCIGSFLAVPIESRRREIDVVCLPSHGRQTHVQIRRFDRVQPASFVIFSFKPKRIEHLRFVPALMVQPTITASLPPRLGHVRKSKLKMHRVVTEGVGARTTFHQQTVVRDACPILPMFLE